MPPPAGFRSRSSLLMLGGGLLVGAGLIGVIALTGGDKAAPVAAAPVAMPQPIILPAGAPPVVAPALPTVTESRNVGMAIASNAAEAKVLIRGQSQPLPMAFEIERGSQPELVEVTAPGFAGKRFWLKLDKPTRLVAKLKPGKGMHDASETETRIALGELPDPEPAITAAARVQAENQPRLVKPTHLASTKVTTAPAAPPPAAAEVAAATPPAPAPAAIAPPTAVAPPVVAAPAPAAASIAPAPADPALVPAPPTAAPAPLAIATRKPSVDPVLAQRFVDGRSHEVVGCLKRKKVSLGTKGTVKLELAVGADGKVTRASVRSSSVEDPAVYACAMTTARAWTLPKPTDGKATTVTVWFPLPAL